MVRVCYFGIYIYKDKPRTQVLFEGLKSHDIEIVECNAPYPQVNIQLNGKSAYFLHHIVFSLGLLKSYVMLTFLFFLKSRGCKCVIVGFPFHYDAILASALCFLTRKELLVDYFMSMYETSVIDRKVISPNSFTARKLFLLDYITTHLAHKLIVDTKTHAEYFSQLLNLNPDKFIVTLVGSSNNIFTPVKSVPSKIFNVLFYGYYTPLQGIKYIIKAAKLLEEFNDVKFTILGTGQTYVRDKELCDSLGCKNISFIGEVKLQNLQIYIGNACLCLGIFGDTIKTDVVIPHKAYETVAMGKPFLTSRTPAIEEFFSHGKNCFLCNKADEHSLANAILYLKNNPAVCERIAKNGQQLFQEKFTPEKVVVDLVDHLKNSNKAMVS